MRHVGDSYRYARMVIADPLPPPASDAEEDDWRHVGYKTNPDGTRGDRLWDELQQLNAYYVRKSWLRMDAQGIEQPRDWDAWAHLSNVHTSSGNKYPTAFYMEYSAADIPALRASLTVYKRDRQR